MTKDYLDTLLSEEDAARHKEWLKEHPLGVQEELILAQLRARDSREYWELLIIRVLIGLNLAALAVLWFIRN